MILGYEPGNVKALLNKNGWVNENKLTFTTGPAGEVALLSAPIVLQPAVSSLTGSVVDVQGHPLQGVEIVATQLAPVAGYEEFRTITDSQGAFTFDRLFPESGYVFKTESGAEERAQSLPAGKSGGFNSPLTMRFFISDDGVITDTKTNLEWVMGSDRDTQYRDAVAWVRVCGISGRGWRMPSRDELQTLFNADTGERRMDPVFKSTGSGVWAEPRDSVSAWYITFTGEEGWGSIFDSGHGRAFAVRSRR
jgi:hypothetical protein